MSEEVVLRGHLHLVSPSAGLTDVMVVSEGCRLVTRSVVLITKRAVLVKFRAGISCRASVLKDWKQDEDWNV